jgi:phosphotriesterase-related protein
MLHELRRGIGTSGVRAGIIKVATGLNTIHPVEERVLRAAARAQRETGCCISTHTTGSSMGLEQIAIFAEEGADVSRVIIGHSDDRDDLDYVHQMLERGVTVEFDHIGANNAWTLPDTRKVEIIASLISEGFAQQLTLSHDSLASIRGRPAEVQPLHRRPSHVLTWFTDELRHSGVSDVALEQMLVHNPARLLPF